MNILNNRGTNIRGTSKTYRKLSTYTNWDPVESTNVNIPGNKLPDEVDKNLLLGHRLLVDSSVEKDPETGKSTVEYYYSIYDKEDSLVFDFHQQIPDKIGEEIKIEKERGTSENGLSPSKRNLAALRRWELEQKRREQGGLTPRKRKKTQIRKKTKSKVDDQTEPKKETQQVEPWNSKSYDDAVTRIESFLRKKRAIDADKWDKIVDSFIILIKQNWKKKLKKDYQSIPNDLYRIRPPAKGLENQVRKIKSIVFSDDNWRILKKAANNGDENSIIIIIFFICYVYIEVNKEFDSIRLRRRALPSHFVDFFPDKKSTTVDYESIYIPALMTLGYEFKTRYNSSFVKSLIEAN